MASFALRREIQWQIKVHRALLGCNNYVSVTMYMSMFVKAVQAAGLPDKHFGYFDLGLSDLDQEGPLHELLA